MEEIKINKANKNLSWVTAIIIIIGLISFIWLMIVIFEKIDISILLDSNQIEERLIELEEKLLNDENFIKDFIIPSLLFSLSSLIVLGLSVAGLIVSIISLVKCNKYKLPITGSILTIIGYSIALLFNVTVISIAALVLLIIGAIKLKENTSISYEKLEKLKILKKS